MRTFHHLTHDLPGKPPFVPPASPASEPHRRTRRDHATETAEDYVEAIAELEASRGECRLVELAKRFGVSHVTVNRTVSRLCKEGLAETAPYQPVSLTARGRRLANRCRKRHEVVLQFLVSIGVPAEVAAIDAEGMEHHVSPQTLRRFEAIASEKDAGCN
ncbi:MAG: manganese-binding transcriptional regulator MntR [Planctomycetota bacterium]